MFVNKGTINTSRFFPTLHHKESPEKPQNNMATPPFLDKHLHFALPPPFLANIFELPPPPILSILKKSNPPPPFMKERVVRTMYHGPHFEFESRSFNYSMPKERSSGVIGERHSV